MAQRVLHPHSTLQLSHRRDLCCSSSPNSGTNPRHILGMVLLWMRAKSSTVSRSLQCHRLRRQTVVAQLTIC
uniref:Uncharacterized protein n=1 Tax=Arundo donax TaxID=35708 RepID=A0A0A9HFY2_ARUDO